MSPGTVRAIDRGRKTDTAQLRRRVQLEEKNTHAKWKEFMQQAWTSGVQRNKPCWLLTELRKMLEGIMGHDRLLSNLVYVVLPGRDGAPSRRHSSQLPRLQLHTRTVRFLCQSLSVEFEMNNAPAKWGTTSRLVLHRYRDHWGTIPRFMAPFLAAANIMCKVC
jgi:hypothetical protein